MEEDAFLNIFTFFFPPGKQTGRCDGAVEEDACSRAPNARQHCCQRRCPCVLFFFFSVTYIYTHKLSHTCICILLPAPLPLYFFFSLHIYTHTLVYVYCCQRRCPCILFFLFFLTYIYTHTCICILLPALLPLYSFFSFSPLLYMYVFIGGGVDGGSLIGTGECVPNVFLMCS